MADPSGYENLRHTVSALSRRFDEHERAEEAAFSSIRDMIGGFEPGGPSISAQLRAIQSAQDRERSDRKTAKWILGLIATGVLTLALDKINSWLRGDHAAATAVEKAK